MARRYFLDELPQEGTCRLPRETAHHLVHVLRAQPGDEVVLSDGRGRQTRARLARVAGGHVEAELGPIEEVERGARLRLELAFACPKGSRADWLFEHATELGVAALRPIITARADRGTHRRHERWLRIVRAAAGQCDRTHLPEIWDPEPLAELLARADLPAERWLASAEGGPLAPAQADALLLVGPPGGFTTEEVAAAEGAGFRPGSLGRLTLRTETAALAGAAVLLSGE